MSEHLPECANWRIGEDDSECICPQLRACEQRVLNLNPVAHDVLIAQRARERALDAAREALVIAERRLHFDGDDNRWIVEIDAIAAIDALREEQK